jgi:hypothetical protein
MKIVYYIIIIKEIIVFKLIELFILYIIKDFKIFISIIFNKSFIFTSKF